MNTFVADLFSVEHRVALVTGASSGIGCHMAGVLAQAGAKVVLVARRQNNLDEAVAGLRERGADAIAVAWDVSDIPRLEDLAAVVRVEAGDPTIVVNAAGVNPRLAADTIDPETWAHTLALNLSAPFYLSRACVPAMRTAGTGNIINIASLQTSRAFANGIAYGAVKGGVGQLTRAMAEASSGNGSGIIANAIAPGFFPTELTAPVFEDPATAAHHAAKTCIGRNGELPDLDGALLFLASRASRYVTGQIIPVDGGYTAK